MKDPPADLAHTEGGDTGILSEICALLEGEETFLTSQDQGPPAVIPVQSEEEDQVVRATSQPIRATGPELGDATPTSRLLKRDISKHSVITKDGKVIRRKNSLGQKQPKCCAFLCSMIIKNSFLYGLNFLLNISFVGHQLFSKNYISGGIGLFFMLKSIIASHYLATKAHVHVHPIEGRNSFLKHLGVFVRMVPFIQILWIYRYNRKNHGLLHYMYYRLTLTHYSSHMVETSVMILLRISYPAADKTSLSYMASAAPILLNILSLIVATVDWEKHKRSKNQTSFDTMLAVECCGCKVNIQTAVRFLIYTLMISARAMALFVLFYGIKWASSELPYMIYGCHVILFFFNFGVMWLRREAITVENFFKTVFLSLNQTLFNQLDCFLAIPFKLHFISTYVINFASILVIVGLHLLFKSKDIDGTFNFVMDIMGYCAIALHIFAGIFVFLYKKFICPDILKIQEIWKTNKGLLSNV